MTPQPTDPHARVQVAIASDHAGVGLKSALVDWLGARGISLRDLGPYDAQSVDYPDFARILGEEVAQGRAQKGVLICGSGVGVSIAVNKVAGIRAALVSDPLTAELARRHNDANVLCLGARIIGEEMARACVQAFLNGVFEPGDDGRHQRRVDKIARVGTSAS